MNNPKRDNLIYREKMKGLTYFELGKKYTLHPNTIYNIVKKLKMDKLLKTLQKNQHDKKNK